MSALNVVSLDEYRQQRSARDLAYERRPARVAFARELVRRELGGKVSSAILSDAIERVSTGVACGGAIDVCVERVIFEALSTRFAAFGR